jgi:SAM-dependent methyltransferase
MTLLPAGRTKATALNVGSGPRPTGDLTFLYVDRTAWPVDVMADLRSLPFRDGTFSHVHCSHTIEHIPRSEVIAALRELRRVVHPDGGARPVGRLDRVGRVHPPRRMEARLGAPLGLLGPSPAAAAVRRRVGANVGEGPAARLAAQHAPVAPRLRGPLRLSPRRLPVAGRVPR